MNKKVKTVVVILTGFVCIALLALVLGLIPLYRGK